jgi:transcriptional regulator with XRE-family HTH domain
VPNTSKHSRSEPLLALGQTIRDIRMEKGMTREQLSAVADVDVSYLGRVERGDNNVAFTTLLKIANGLGLSVNELTQKANL